MKEERVSHNKKRNEWEPHISSPEIRNFKKNRKRQPTAFSSSLNRILIIQTTLHPINSSNRS